MLITSSATGEGVHEAFDIIMQKTLALYLENNYPVLEKAEPKIEQLFQDLTIDNDTNAPEQEIKMLRPHVTSLTAELETDDSIKKNIEQAFVSHLKSAERGSVDSFVALLMMYLRGEIQLLKDNQVISEFITILEASSPPIITLQPFFRNFSAGEAFKFAVKDIKRLIQEEIITFESVEQYLKNWFQDLEIFQALICLSNDQSLLKDKDESLGLIRSKAAGGSSNAQCFLGLLHLRGISNLLPEDSSEAINWLKKAVEQNHPEAQISLGFIYLIGNDDISINEEGLKLLESSSKSFLYSILVSQLGDLAVFCINLKKALLGNMQAQYELGSLFYNKQESRWYVHYSIAFQFFLSAAQQGHGRSQYMIGLMYDEGKGVEVCKIKAIEWYVKSVQSMSPSMLHHSLFKLASICFSYKKENAEKWLEKSDKKNMSHPLYALADVYISYGSISPPSEDYPPEPEEKLLITKLCSQSHYYALISLGNMYSIGSDGLFKNIEKALECYGKAAELLHVMEYAIDDEEEEMIVWLRKSAQNKNAAAQICLGRILATTKNEYQNDSEAEKWFKFAVDQGFPNAQACLDQIKSKINLIQQAQIGDALSQYKLAKLYRYGSPVVRADKEVAFKLLEKSAEQEYVPAQFVLYEMYKAGEGLDRNTLAANEWHRSYETVIFKLLKTEQISAIPRTNSFPRMANIDAQPLARNRSVSSPPALDRNNTYNVSPSKHVLNEPVALVNNHMQKSHQQLSVSEYQQSLETRIKELELALCNESSALAASNNLLKDLLDANEQLEKIVLEASEERVSHDDTLKNTEFLIKKVSERNTELMQENELLRQKQIQDEAHYQEKLKAIESDNISLRQAASDDKAQYAQEKAELQAQIEKNTRELASLQEQKKAAQELVEISEQALREQITLNENLNQEMSNTAYGIKKLEQQLILSEARAKSKAAEHDKLQQQILTLQQNPIEPEVLTRLQEQSRQLLEEKNKLEQENQQLNAQCSALKMRLQILENEHITFSHLPETEERVSQLKIAVQKAQNELVAKELIWQSKFKQEQKAKDEVIRAAAKADEQVELLKKTLAVFEKHGLSPKERAFQNFLLDVKRQMKKSKCSMPTCYISYTWEDDKTDEGKAKLEEQQKFLTRLSKDLKTLGAEVFLDVISMTGDIAVRQETLIAKSDYIILIGTERLPIQVQDPETNVSKEWAAIQRKIQKNTDALIPLLFKGEFTKRHPFTNAFPLGAEKSLIRDCRNTDDYYQAMSRMMKPMGIIRAVFDIYMNGKNSFLVDPYEKSCNNFEKDFIIIENASVNAISTQAQSTPSYAAPTINSTIHAGGSSSSNSSTLTPINNKWKGKSPVRNAPGSSSSSSSAASNINKTKV